MFILSNEELVLDQRKLVQAWSNTLPTTLRDGEHAIVTADGADPHMLRIHIDAAGRQMYSFDFQCTYVDSREVKVDLVDVERDGTTVDERTESIQEMAQNYVRHIHECAQALHDVTHP
ncbi:hypothetical protein PAE9249_05297 [Paenibacillus sp. CECT 9249]|nr:hypothetical protein PAE9249_05297 [Paenibacillus sp. CECT 9249]